MENKALKGHEALAGTKEYQVKKKLSAKLASCGPWRGKQADVLSSDTFRSPGGESVIAEVIARPRLNLREVNVSRLNWSKTTL